MQIKDSFRQHVKGGSKDFRAGVGGGGRYEVQTVRLKYVNRNVNHCVICILSKSAPIQIADARCVSPSSPQSRFPREPQILCLCCWQHVSYGNDFDNCQATGHAHLPNGKGRRGDASVTCVYMFAARFGPHKSWLLLSNIIVLTCLDANLNHVNMYIYRECRQKSPHFEWAQYVCRHHLSLKYRRRY